MLSPRFLNAVAFLVVPLTLTCSLVHARGRGGFSGGRGGGFSRGGGGGFSAGAARPSMGSRSYGSAPSFNRTPSFSRPSQPIRSTAPSYSRPSQPIRSASPSVSRPSQPVRSASPSYSRGTSSIGRSPGSVSFPKSGTSGSRVGDRQIGSVDRTPGNRIGDRQIGSVDRTPSNRVGDRQIGGVDRTPGNRMGDRQIGAVDRTPANRVGDRQIGGVDRTPVDRVGDGKLGAVDRMPRVGDGQLGSVDRTPRDIGRAAIPGLVSGNDPGSRLSGDMRDQLSQRRDQFQDNRKSGEYQDRLQSRFENRDELVDARRDQLQDRMDNRPNSPEDRQDLREERREDWQDWVDNDPWDDHWDHDCWHEHFEDYWDHMWDEHPVWSTFRVTTWGINRANYLFGWSGYYNPYPVPVYTSGTTVIDYSEPLVINAPMEQYVTADTAFQTDTVAGTPVDGSSQVAAAASPFTATDTAVARFDEARTSFKKGDYEGALTSVDAAIGELPKDATLHEFRSLILFALQKYRESAAGIHAVLAVGPGMNWTTMNSYYSDQAKYIEQLRALESHIRSNPNEADARFLIAYHYITLGHKDSAVKQLQLVVDLEPKDTVASDLIVLLGGTVSKSTTSQPEVAFTKASEEELIGQWRADRGDSSFKLELDEAGEFTWTYKEQGGDAQTIKGVFAVKDGLLAMEPDSGGVMLADVSKPENETFKFRQNGTGGDSIAFQKM